MVNLDAYRQSKVRPMPDIDRLLLSPYIVKQVEHDFDAGTPNELVVGLNAYSVIHESEGTS